MVEKEKCTGGLVMGYDYKVSHPTKVTDERLWELINSTNPVSELSSILQELKLLRSLLRECKEDGEFWFMRQEGTYSMDDEKKHIALMERIGEG